MVVVGQDPTMYECRVLYIGSAPPIETLKGLDAVQEPLRQRYPKDLSEVKGYDATICVRPTCLEVRYTDTGDVIEFPLDRLSICAGVRAVSIVDGTTGEQSRQFVPVNTVQEDSEHPAVFAAIIRRKTGRQIAECHMFICNSTRDALHLVNTSAAANMNSKKVKGQRVEANTRANDVIVVRPDISNGYADDGGYVIGGNYETTPYGQTTSNTVRVETDEGQFGSRGYVVGGNFETQPYGQTTSNTVHVGTDESQLESKHFQIQPSKVKVPEPETIYITFDKKNLISKGDDRMELRYGTRQSQRTEEYRQPFYTGAPPPPPPQPGMRPVLVRPPPPPPMMYHRPPQRLYTKRMMAQPPPPQRFISQPPMYVRSRARSASPVGRYNSEIRVSKKEAYQPKWEGAKRPKSDVAPRMSRRDMYNYPPPPPQQNLEFFQQSGAPRGMYLNERAFSRRIHADNRITRDHAYHYPTAYDLFGDRPTTKSNPRYSSSSSSSDDGQRNSRPRR